MKKVSKKDLLNIVDDELNFIKDNTNSGWTEWVVISSLAAIFWLFLNILLKNFEILNFYNILKYLLIIFLFSDAFYYLYYLIYKIFNRDEFLLLNIKRTEKPNLIETNKIISIIFKYSIIVFLLFFIQFSLKESLVIKFVYTFLLLALAIWHGIISRFLPMRKTRTNKWLLVLMIIVISSFLISVIKTININKVIVEDVVVSLLIWGIIFLVLRYISLFLKNDSPLLILQDIKRGINFKYLSLNDAKKQLKFLIYGKETSHFMEESFYKIFVTMRDLEFEIDKMEVVDKEKLQKKDLKMYTKKKKKMIHVLKLVQKEMNHINWNLRFIKKFSDDRTIHEAFLVSQEWSSKIIKTQDKIKDELDRKLPSTADQIVKK